MTVPARLATALFVLIGAVLLQTRGSGFSSFGSSDSSIYRTRRGFERTLFQFTTSALSVSQYRSTGKVLRLSTSIAP